MEQPPQKTEHKLKKALRPKPERLKKTPLSNPLYCVVMK
jgi:hypothetical protein